MSPEYPAIYFPLLGNKQLLFVQQACAACSPRVQHSFCLLMLSANSCEYPLSLALTLRETNNEKAAPRCARFYKQIHIRWPSRQSYFVGAQNLYGTCCLLCLPTGNVTTPPFWKQTSLLPERNWGLKFNFLGISKLKIWTVCFTHLAVFRAEKAGIFRRGCRGLVMPTLFQEVPVVVVQQTSEQCCSFPSETAQCDAESCTQSSFIQINMQLSIFFSAPPFSVIFKSFGKSPQLIPKEIVIKEFPITVGKAFILGSHFEYTTRPPVFICQSIAVIASSKAFIQPRSLCSKCAGNMTGKRPCWRKERITYQFILSILAPYSTRVYCLSL